MNLIRNGLRVHAFVNLNGLFGGVADYPAIRALRDVAFEFPPEFRIDFLVFVEKIVEFGEELFTSKQKRRPLSA